MIEYFEIFLASLVFIPVSIFFLQVAFGLRSHRPRPLNSLSRPNIAILIPAHNEAAVIASTLASIKPQLQNGDRLIVIADNCSDNTTLVATQQGAEVIERFDENNRGKGFALDYGIRYLAANPPEILLMIDADCEISANTIDWLTLICLETSRPVQALYLMYAPENAGLATRIAEFAWLVKNQIRPLGYFRLGLPCGLMGTGMAFPWKIISQAKLGTSQIVEDLKMGIDFACLGYAPVFCPEALVTSYFPSNSAGVKTQRTRWEHGHLALILSEVPQLLTAMVKNKDWRLLLVALELSVPPLALLTILVVALLLFNSLFATSLALTMSLIEFLLLFIAILLSWWLQGRQILSLTDLSYAPIYALRKIPIYLNFLIRRQVEWIRSSREDS